MKIEMINAQEDKRFDLEKAIIKFQEKYIKASVPVEGVLREEDFEGKYSKNVILDDKQRVNKKKHEYAKKAIADPDLLRTHENNKKLEILNYIVFEMVKSAKLFGERVTAKKTTDTDSMFNGIDVVLEVEKKMKENNNNESSISRLGVAMDIMSLGSINGFSEAANKKLRIIKNHIELGNLGSLKYFKSTDQNADKSSSLPEIFINIEPKVVDELIDLWVNNDYEGLAKNKVKVMIIHQITTQLHAQENYARSETVNRPEAAGILKESLNIWKDIQSEIDLEFPDTAKDYNEKKDEGTIELYSQLLEAA
ncbi:MAG TPA: hypothetical protein PK720_02295 [bacterium]|nr:hypothetical protein [bacterium]